MSSLEGLVGGEKPSTKEGKEHAGWKLQLQVKLQELILDTEVRYKKILGKPLIEIEGEKQRVGPNGRAVRSEQKDAYFELDADGKTWVPITEDQMKYIQHLPDGTVMEIEKLHRIEKLVIDDRNVEEATIDDSITYGALVPKFMKSNFVEQDTYQLWGNVLPLYNYLEKNQYSVLYPWTFGRGFKITTAFLTTLRLGENRMFMPMILHTGIGEYTKDVVGAEAVVSRPNLKRPVLKTRVVLQTQ